MVFALKRVDGWCESMGNKLNLLLRKIVYLVTIMSGSYLQFRVVPREILRPWPVARGVFILINELKEV